jgi:hypothetical protein
MALLVTVLGLSIAAAAGASSVTQLILAFSLAWGLVELGLRTSLAPRLVGLARRERVLLVLVAVVPALEVASRRDALADAEGWRELAPRWVDRARLARRVAIAPPLVVAGRAQTFFVRAEGAGTVRVGFEGEDAIEAASLGHGVFRVDATPRGVDRSREDITVTISVDGAVHDARLLHHAPVPHPRGIRVGDQHALCFVSEESGEVFFGVLGALRSMPVTGGPAACAVVGGAVWVAVRDEPSLVTIAAEGSVAARGPAIGRGAVAMASEGTKLAIARSGERRELVVLDALAGSELGRARVEGVPLEVAFAGDRIVLTTRSPARLELRALDGALLASRDLVMPAAALAASPRAIAIATTAFDEAARDNLGNHFVEDQLVWLDPRTLAPTRVVPTARRTDRQDHAGDADRGLGPAALAFDDDARLYVAFVSSSELAVFSPDAPTRGVDLGDRFFGPSGVAIDGDTVLAGSAIDGALVALDRRSLEVTAGARVAPTNAELLREAPRLLQVRLGERSFFEGTRAGASCHSCHLGGSTDGEAHNIGGRVLAPTLDVRGLAGTAPFLRDGSYARLGDLHDVAVLEYRGYREPAGDRRATLEAYLASLPIPVSLADRDVVREQRGLDAFVRAGCAGCHAAPAFTTLARHPLRTIFPDHPGDAASSLDVPALRNLRGQEPYLHDGRARSLLEVLTSANAANRHGDTRALSEQDRADLVFFLETL